MKLHSTFHFNAKKKIYAALAFIILLLHLTSSANAAALRNDTTLSAEIKRVLASKVEMSGFHYPKSVERFYSHNGFQVMWASPQKDIRKTWEALLMLDCVLQFGLNHADYHPKEVLYSTMHDILERSSTVSVPQTVRFDMLLSDALITFMNHLHFGKLNPAITAETIDEGRIMGFCAEDILRQAIPQNDFMSAVLNVQPKVREYVLMQDYMRLMKGQYMDDCYEAPEGIVRKLAINMERLRWAAISEDTFIRINIPSYTLKLQTPDTAYQFKVIVGKPGNQTHELQSSLTHFSTAPDWKVPMNIFTKEILPKALKNPAYLDNNHFAVYDHSGNYIAAVKENLLAVKRNPGNYFLRQSGGCDNALGLVVFRFQNPHDIYLHDTPEQQFFNRDVRALSHGCIRVQQAEKLATLLLALDGAKQKAASLHRAMATYQAKTFTLKKPVPIKITYLTCEIGELGVVEYDDVYKKDKALEAAFYGPNIPDGVKEVKLKTITY